MKIASSFPAVAALTFYGPGVRAGRIAALVAMMAVYTASGSAQPPVVDDRPVPVQPDVASQPTPTDPTPTTPGRTQLTPPTSPQTAAPRSDPERWASEMARLRAEDAATPPAPGGTIFVGSSTIRLWDTASDFDGVVNRGFGGSTIPDVLTHFDTVVTPHQPARIVFYCGDNDLARGRTPEHVAADFQTFVRKVRAISPDARIAFLGIKPSGKRWELWPTMQKANDLIRAFCQTDHRLTYLDTAPSLLGEDGQPIDALFKADRLHLSDEGYARWKPLVDRWIAATQ